MMMIRVLGVCMFIRLEQIHLIHFLEQYLFTQLTRQVCKSGIFFVILQPNKHLCSSSIQQKVVNTDHHETNSYHKDGEEDDDDSANFTDANEFFDESNDDGTNMYNISTPMVSQVVIAPVENAPPKAKPKPQKTMKYFAKWFEDQNFGQFMMKSENIEMAIQKLSKIRPTSEKDKYMHQTMSTALNGHLKKLQDMQFYKDFLVFLVLLSFKQASIIIDKLRPSPRQDYDGRFKTAWTKLRYDKLGRAHFNFTHVLKAVPESFIEKLENAKKYTATGKIKTAPYFNKEKVISNLRDEQLNLYFPIKKCDGSCIIHPGNRARSDCLICKRKLPKNYSELQLMPAVLNKLNQSYSLLEFAMKSQQQKK